MPYREEYNLEKNISKLKTLLKNKGIRETAIIILRYLLRYFKFLRQYFIYSIFNRYFYFDGTKIRYSKAFYNSVDNERVIEIPINIT